MRKITTTELKAQTGECLDRAQMEPIEIQRNGKTVAMLISQQEYARLNKNNKEYGLARINASSLEVKDAKQLQDLFQTVSGLCTRAREAKSIAKGKGKRFQKDVGEFRIVYSFDKDSLFVTVLGNTNDSAAYLEFERRE